MNKKGIITWHVDVGQLPLNEALKYVDDFKKKYEKEVSFIPEDFIVIFIPNRVQKSGIEYLQFS